MWHLEGHIRAVYTRENKPRLTLAAAYVSRERNYLYEYNLPGQDKTRLEKAVNVDFVPFTRGVRGLCKPRPELAAAYFLSYKRPYCPLRTYTWRQCSPVVSALAFRPRDPGFKSRSDHSLNLFQVVPASVALVNNQLVCLQPVGILKVLFNARRY